MYDTKMPYAHHNRTLTPAHPIIRADFSPIGAPNAIIIKPIRRSPQVAKVRSGDNYPSSMASSMVNAKKARVYRRAKREVQLRAVLKNI